MIVTTESQQCDCDIAAGPLAITIAIAPDDLHCDECEPGEMQARVRIGDEVYVGTIRTENGSSVFTPTDNSEPVVGFHRAAALAAAALGPTGQIDRGGSPNGHARPVTGYATRVGRNDACTCGSGKKRKKCCQ